MEGVDPDALWVLVQYAYTGMCLSGTDLWLDIHAHLLRMHIKILADRDINQISGNILILWLIFQFFCAKKIKKSENGLKIRYFQF